MKVALIGASGLVGSRLLNELLDRGHEVTGIVRNPKGIDLRPGLTIKKGNVNDGVAIAPSLPAMMRSSAQPCFR